jgi:hypothetical protein
LRLFLSILCVINCISCSLTESFDLKNFDKTLFKRDRLACLGNRKEFIASLESQKDDFLGKSENQIYQAIGRYDYQALDNKNEKVLVFFLEKGPQCESIRKRTSAKTLVLKLNSVSLVKEVIFQNGGFE